MSHCPTLSEGLSLLESCDTYQERLLDAILAGTINPDRHYAPRGASAALLFCTLPEVVISGPAGPGKSRACLEKLHYLARTYDGAHLLVLRKARSDLNDTGLETFERHVLGQDHLLVAGGPKRPWRKSYDYSNGSSIVTGGMDRSSKVLSSEWDAIYVQQAEELSLWDWETLTTRLRGKALPFRQMMACCNPQSPTHWLKARAGSGGAAMLEADHKDNPILWDLEADDWTEFGREYIGTLDRLTGSRKLRLRYGLWVVPEGMIYSVFNEERHKVASFPIPPLWPRIVAIDPVGAHIAALWLAFDPVGGVLNAYREYREPYGQPSSWHVRNILELSKGETIFAWVGGGPSERQPRTDWQAMMADWQGQGIPLMAPPNVGVWNQIDDVIELLKDFRLVIHDSCAQLLSDIGAYQRKMRNGEPTDTIQDKEKFDLADCLRYGVSWLTQPQEQYEVVNRLVPIARGW